MTIQEKAAVLLGVSYADNSAVLDILAEMVANEVEAYCNVDDIPAG